MPNNIEFYLYYKTGSFQCTLCACFFPIWATTASKSNNNQTFSWPPASLPLLCLFLSLSISLFYVAAELSRGREETTMLEMTLQQHHRIHISST